MRAQTLLIALLLRACGGASSTTPTPETTQPEARYDRLPRLRFNQLGLRVKELER